MKKVFSLYRSNSDMIRPTVYKCFSKTLYALVFVLGLDVILPKVNGSLTVWDRCFMMAALFLVMAWVTHLRLDGVGKNLPRWDKRPKKKHFWTNDIVDFVDEHVVTFDELDDDEQLAVGFTSSLICFALYIVPALVGVLINQTPA